MQLVPHLDGTLAHEWPRDILTFWRSCSNHGWKSWDKFALLVLLCPRETRIQLHLSNLAPGPSPPHTMLKTTTCNFSLCSTLGSLSTRVFETRTATGREQFAFLDRIVSQIFILFISNGEKVLNKVNVVVWGQVKSENSSLPVAVRVSKTRVLKLPIVLCAEGEQ